MASTRPVSDTRRDHAVSNGPVCVARRQPVLEGKASPTVQGADFDQETVLAEDDASSRAIEVSARRS